MQFVMRKQVKHRMKNWISALIVLALLGGAFFWTAGPAAAQNTVDLDTAAVDALVEAQMKKHNLPGVALAITQGEEIVYLKGYGTAGAGQPVTPQTPFYIGSISKPFTSLAVMQLVEEGKIDLNAPVQTYLPWFAVADEEASRTITIRTCSTIPAAFQMPVLIESCRRRSPAKMRCVP